MAPRKKSHRRVITPPESEPASPSVAFALQPEASTSQVNPGDILANNKQAHGGSGPDTGIWLNNPDAVPPKCKNKNLASDIEFFFDRTGARAVCKECKWVSYVLSSSVFWHKQWFVEKSKKRTQHGKSPLIRTIHQPCPSALIWMWNIWTYFSAQPWSMDGRFRRLDLKLDTRLLLCNSHNKMNLPSGHSINTYSTLLSQMTRFVHIFRLFTFTMLMLNHKSVNVIECFEFRKLLLHLRTDIMDAMIPHRTKLHELVIQAWGVHFKVLRAELAVHLPHLIQPFFLNSSFKSRLLWGGSLLQWICGLINLSDHI